MQISHFLFMLFVLLADWIIVKLQCCKLVIVLPVLF